MDQVFGSLKAHKYCGISNLDNSLTDEMLANDTFDAEITEFPWMASIQFKGTHFCGGAVISDRWILTAAHCIQFIIKASILLKLKDLSYFKILLGSNNNTSGQYSFKIEKVVINDCFNIYGVGFDDIALMMTDKQIDFIKTNGSYIINSICLTKGEPIDTKTFFSGWGYYSESIESKTTAPKILKRAVMNLTSLDKCRVTLLVMTGGMTFTSVDNLCIDNSNSTPCFGDSGGPLVQKVGSRWYVLGITSFTVNGCNFKDPVIYTKVSKFIDWIESAVNYSQTTNQQIINFGCNRFVIFYELRNVVHRIQAFFQ